MNDLLALGCAIAAGVVLAILVENNLFGSR